jgi:hypothetical protein
MGDVVMTDEELAEIRERVAMTCKTHPEGCYRQAVDQLKVRRLLATLDRANERCAAAEALIAKYEANPLWNVRVVEPPPGALEDFYATDPES